MDQQQIMQVQMLEQESNQLNQQMQMLEQNINEMNELKDSLNELENHKEGEMLVNIGKKIYLPVETKPNKLIVEVGRGNLVEKNIPDTKKVIEEQIEKLNMGKAQVQGRLGELQQEMMRMIGEIENAQKEESDVKDSSEK
jgi:prefoldin alpha subunit